MKYAILSVLLILVTGVIQAQPQEVTLDPDSSLVFATVTAIGGDFAVVNISTLFVTGAIVYQKDGETWTGVDFLTGDPDATSNDPQGFTSAAMDEDRIIFGDGTYDFPTGVNQGIAYVYKRDGETWSREGTLTASDGGGNDDFGVSSVGISGDVAIVGAPNDDDNGSASGSAYVFRYNGTAWVEEDKLLPADGMAEQEFGFQVDIDGDYAVVGVLIDSEAGALAGAAYVFEYDGMDWVETQKLFASDPIIAAAFGSDVSIDDGRILVGARGANGATTANGAAYVFEKEGETWVEQAKLYGANTSGGAFFGHAVSLDGDCAAIGAFNESSSTGGAGYTFALSDGTWTEVAEVRASNSSGTNQFGLVVGVSNGNMIAGAPFADINNNQMFTGAAYIYSDACTTTSTSIDAFARDEISGVTLLQNFPNPFSTSTAIQFELNEPVAVRLRVYNLLGQEVAELENGMRTVGVHSVQFDRSDLPGGIYFYQLEYGESNIVRKMTILN